MLSLIPYIDLLKDIVSFFNKFLYLEKRYFRIYIEHNDALQLFLLRNAISVQYQHFFKCMCTCRDACIFASLLGKRKIQGFPPNGA